MPHQEFSEVFTGNQPAIERAVPLEESETEQFNVLAQPQITELVQTSGGTGSSTSSEWLPTGAPRHQSDVPVQLQTTNTISMQNYRRAANSAAYCIFPNCDSNDLHRINDDIRIYIIQDYHYYIPEFARVCSRHLNENSWDVLYDSENSSAVFTVDQIEHMFSFINVKRPINFNDVLSMSDHLFLYWIGLSKDNFQILLNEVPRIRETHRGVTGLVGLLIKFRTGDPDNRIASLMEISRSTLERLMKNVREILLQDFVIRNMGLNHLTREQIIEHNLLIPNGIFNK